MNAGFNLMTMEIIFTEFIFAYSLAECHKKVATIIFYFARAGIFKRVRGPGIDSKE